MKISMKLPVMIVILALVASVVAGVEGYISARQELVKSAEGKLVALMESRRTALNSYLNSIYEDLRIMKGNFMVHQATKDFAGAWDKLGGGQLEKLQKLYITDNPNKTGEKEKLDFAPDGSEYSKMHAKYHPWFRSFLKTRDYYDIFLIRPDGELVYTVFKELDYATNLLTGKWKDSDLGKVFQEVKENPKPDFVTFKDFSPYAPSHGAPASFMAMPLLDGGAFIGALVFQMPIDRINAVMQIKAGMGKSGETYIVGPDHLMRSDSRFSKKSTILKTKVPTATVKKALTGKTGVEITPDYRGIPVVSAYGLLKFLGVNWAIMAEIDEAEVLEPVKELLITMLIFGVISLAVLSIIGIFIARSISKPIGEMTTAMSVIADGNLDADVPYLGHHDEMGDMASAVQVFKENAVERQNLEREQREAAKRAEKEKQELMNSLADEFDQSVGQSIETVLTSTNEMTNTAQIMSETANSTTEQSSAAANAAEQATTNVQTVSAAADELASSIQEISAQVAKSTEIAASAVHDAERTNEQIQGLAEAASKIGEVVALITDIAEQTNLLALNATIEAARAGDAGKGFAVVASEVKNLANQTAKATEDISEQIGGIQGATQSAVEAIETISKTINNMNEIASAISAAVEEQGAATQEIARNVEQAATGTQEMSSNIASVTKGAGETGQASNQVLTAASELSEQAKSLRGHVDKFLGQIRNA